MIHPVDAPLVFSSRRHADNSESGDPPSTRRSVYRSRNDGTTTPSQIRDDHRSTTTWGQLYRSMGRMPVKADQNSSSDRLDDVDVATATAASIGKARKSDVLHFPAPVQTPSTEAPLELKTAELNIVSNCKLHHTEEYFMVHRTKNPQLVLRRGADFIIHLTFYRAFEAATDSLKLVFEIDDSTYLEAEQDRDEYVLNDGGKIWRGSHNSLRPTYWNFGQFEPGVLEASISVLERSRLPYPQRASPLQVSRLLAKVVNSVDGSGILIGNWSNDFGGGTPPTEWTGSVKILKRYAESGQSVPFGQCWVFAGVATTILRCLGIPSRVVTNYASAHDSSTTVAIDLHINNAGKIDRTHTTDSIWAYHVWNECWFSRPDLPTGYGGWQAIDSTPEEKSDGLYHVGPTSVCALRAGHVGFSYGTAYLFAEVNADKCYWLMQEDGSQRLIDVQSDQLGLCISTKRPGRKITGMNNDDRLDITQLYKYSEKSSGKLEVLDSLLPGHCQQTRTVGRKQQPVANDVEITWAMNKPVRIGDDFDVAVLICNNSKEERTVKISLRIESMQYFGGEKHKIRSDTKAVTLPAGGKQEVQMNVSLRDYLSKAMPQYAFMLTSLARVIQTGQIFLSTDDFRVKMPNVTIRAPEKLHAGHPSTVVLEFINPLPVMLTHCKFFIDGPGVITNYVVPCKDVSPRGMAKAECQITPWRNSRDLLLVAHFSSDQLQDIDGATSVDAVQK